MLRKFFYILFSLSLLVLVETACNTVEGFGRDVRSVGDAITGHGSVRGY